MNEDEKKLMVNAKKPVGELGSQILDRMNKSHEEMALWGVSHFNISPEDVVLDIGCGGGRNVKRFASQALKVYGLDYSEVSVLKSSKLNEEEISAGKVEIIQGSVSDLPFSDESMDIITGFETVYFWPDFINDLKEVKRVLKPEGLVFFCNELTAGDNLQKRHKEIVELLDMKLFNEETFKKAFEEVGFRESQSFVKGDWICTLAKK